MIKKVSMLLLINVFILQAATIRTDKDIYTPNEEITVHISQMSAKNQDWVAIYPKGASKDWNNIVLWQWTGDVEQRDIVLGTIPDAGDYEARVFYNNSYIIEDMYEFKVQNPVLETKISLDKNEYKTAQKIIVHLEGMPGNEKDWVGIYPKGSNNDWANVKSWGFTGGLKEGDMPLKALDSAGEYEVRVFFNNTYHVEAVKEFRVLEPTVIDLKDEYIAGEGIVVHLENMAGYEKDWVGIYPKGSNNDWANVKSWGFTGGLKEGDIPLKALDSAGEYEARVFFNNTYHVEAVKEFRVKELQLPDEPTKIELNDTYTTGEEIVVHLENMAGYEKDWVGIYPKGSNNDWANVKSWGFTGGLKEGDIPLKALDSAGEYEARVFFNNTYHVEAVKEFRVKDIEIDLDTNLTLSKDKYFTNESITVHFSDMSGNENDWIGIYPKDANNSLENVIYKKYTNGAVDGNITFEAVTSSGEYEVRAFFNDSINLETNSSFRVVTAPTVYEDAEDGVDENWVKVKGNYPPYVVDGALVLTPKWIENGTVNTSEYRLPMNNDTQKILELDIGGLANHRISTVTIDGYMPHFSIGLNVNTTQGRRAMMWDSFFNHGNVHAFKKVYGENTVWLYYPSPVEHVRGFFDIPVGQWDHFRVDLEEALHELEPDNHILSVGTFFATGGILDNIQLSSE